MYLLRHSYKQNKRVINACRLWIINCFFGLFLCDREEVTEQYVSQRPALKIAREERRKDKEKDGRKTDGGKKTHAPPVSPSEEEQEGQISALITNTITVIYPDVDYKPACFLQEALPFASI